MKQSESNQFDKGLSLDLNPNNVDNHSLTAALNATMISRNGNEMVLQNDMGNAKVESAYLPEGYVPVGMKEFGGIVYVASYNPLTDKSQIGSFPSPERNINSEDDVSNNCTFTGISEFASNSSSKIIDNTYKKVILINSILNSGDSFLIIANDSNATKLLEMLRLNIIDLRAVLCGDSGENFDITDTCIRYKYTEVSTNRSVYSIAYCGLSTGNENTSYELTKIFVYNSSTSSFDSIDISDENTYKKYFNVVKQGCGKLYIAEQLIVPDFIESGLSISSTDTHYIFKFTPQAYKYIEGVNNVYVPWNQYPKKNNFKFKITSKVLISNINKSYEGLIWSYTTSSYTLQLEKNKITNNNFEYKIEVLYVYNEDTYTIKNLISENKLDLNKIASGDVEVNKFRYYNTSSTSNSYIDFYYILKPYLSENTDINLQLEYIEYTNSLNLNSNNTYSYLDFDKPSKTFGSYTQRIYYNSDFLEGKVYIGRLNIQTTGDSNRTQTSDWFIIITSSITNNYYFDHPNDCMFPLDSSGITIYIPSKGTVTFKEKKYNSVDTNTHSEKLPHSIPDDKQIYNVSTRQENRTVTFTSSAEITNNSAKDLFTLDYNIVNVTCTKSLSEFSKEGNLSHTETDSESDFAELDYTIEDDEISLASTLYSKFYANLEIANNSLTSDEKYKFISLTSDATIVMPYIYPLSAKSHLSETERLFGGDFLIKTTSTNTEVAYPTRWITYRAYAANYKKWAKFGLVNSNNIDYVTTSNGDLRLNIDKFNEFNEMAGVGETNDEGTYTFSDLLVTDTNWGNICNLLTQYIKNDLNINPTFLPWQAHLEIGTNNAVKGNVSYGGVTYTPLAIYDNSTTINKDNINWNAPGKDYSNIFMKGTNSDWFLILNQENVDGSSKQRLGLVKPKNTSCVMRIIDLFKYIYIPKAHQSLEFEYYKSSTNSNEYVYSNPFTMDATIKLDLELELELKEKSNSSIKLPNFELTNDTYNYQFVTQFKSIDQTSDNIDYLNVNPTFLNVALAYHPDTDTYSQHTFAYNPLTQQTESITMQSPYLYDEDNNRFIRCKSDLQLSNLLSNSIAKAICRGDIVMKQNVISEAFELLINSGSNEFDSKVKNHPGFVSRTWDLCYNESNNVKSNFRPGAFNSNDEPVSNNNWTNYYPMFFGCPTLDKLSPSNNNSLKFGNYKAGQFGIERSNSNTYIFDIINKVYIL